MGALLAGARAAWRAPKVIESGLAVLLTAPASSSRARPDPTREARLASRGAHAAVWRLARVAPSRWRNSCLYRSVAECLALRALDLPARVVIGVGAASPADEVIAHAWVECEGIVCLSTRGDAELETMTLAARRAATGGATAS